MIHRKAKALVLLGLLITLCCAGAFAQRPNNAQQLQSSSQADTWVATDGLNRKIPTAAEVGPVKKDRYVGLFYFVWHGAHGYDQHSGALPNEGVMPKKPTDTQSPYDITQMLAENPDNPAYGPDKAFHYWGEPYFGYYLPNDEWVIRKHAQMLSDAGVDVIILDVTNSHLYLPQVTKIAEVYTDMRQKGLSTPSISFIINTNPVQTATRLYNDFYAKGLFQDLWFNWKGKPLLLCPPEGLPDQVSSFFTLRRSWAWTKGQEWFGDGKDKWPWLDHYPQAYGWHEDPQKPEQITVNIAQHPMSNIGRSFHNGKQPAPGEVRTAEGLNFAEQWKRALEVDPEFVFITGWNEWVAMRFTNGASKQMLGKPIVKGETFFVDLYNEEFSRDAEPVKGGYGDNYYYQMVAYIRRYKGARPVPLARERHSIAVNGQFADWQAVEPVYRDDAGDTFHRKHPGWGRIAEYRNTTGRNDIVECRVASDRDYVSFYVKTAAPLSPWNSPDWMHLYLRVQDSNRPDWEGFQYVVNRKAKNSKKTTLEQSKGGWNWEKVADVAYAVKGNELELRLPKKALSLAGDRFVLDFKWSDNAPADGNPLHWLDKGDTAPNGRFLYRYSRQP